MSITHLHDNGVAVRQILSLFGHGLYAEHSVIPMHLLYKCDLLVSVKMQIWSLLIYSQYYLHRLFRFQECPPLHFVFEPPKTSIVLSVVVDEWYGGV